MLTVPLVGVPFPLEAAAAAAAASFFSFSIIFSAAATARFSLASSSSFLRSDSGPGAYEHLPGSSGWQPQSFPTVQRSYLWKRMISWVKLEF